MLVKYVRKSSFFNDIPAKIFWAGGKNVCQGARGRSSRLFFKIFLAKIQLVGGRVLLVVSSNFF